MSEKNPRCPKVQASGGNRREKIAVSSLEEALDQISADGKHHVVYSALVSIRTKFIKEKHGVSKLRELGGVEKLLSLLRSTNHKVLDVATSILGNCSLEEHTRSKIMSLDGVALLGAVVKTLSAESIQNRACRTLANLAQDKHCCQVIHDNGVQTDDQTQGKTTNQQPLLTSVSSVEEDDEQMTIVESTVRLLEKTSTAECQQTVIRALRLFGDNEEHRRNILEYQGLKVVCQCLKSEDNDVVSTALKCVSHYMQGTITDAVVWQFVNAEGPNSLITLTSHKVKNVSEYASSMLLSFVKHQTLRPCLGNTGAVTCFISKTEAESLSLKQRLPYINGLCLFCHEVVNRVRIRDEHGLELLLKYLDNRNYSMIHYRIISALVCFLHDDPSMELLLQNRLVLILIRHLKKCADLKSLNLIECLLSVSEKQVQFDKTETQSSNSMVYKNREQRQEQEEEIEALMNEDIDTNFEELEDTLVYSDNVIDDVHKSQSKGSLSKQEVDADIGQKNFHRSVSAPALTEEMSEASEGNRAGVSSHTTSVDSSGRVDSDNKQEIKYSMDSPTYKQICELSSEDHPHITNSSGPRNIFEARASIGERYSPYSSPSHSTSIYSPMSTSSYASPSWSLKSSPDRCTSPTESLFSYTQPNSPSESLRTSGIDWSENLPHSSEAGSHLDSDQMGSGRSFSPLTLRSPPSSPSSLHSGGDRWWHSGDTQNKGQNQVYSDEEECNTNDMEERNCPNRTERFGLMKLNENSNSGGSPLFLSQNSDSTFSIPLRSDPVYAETMLVTDFGKALKGEALARAISVESGVLDQQNTDCVKADTDRLGLASAGNNIIDVAHERKGRKRKLLRCSSVSNQKRRGRASVSVFEGLLEKSKNMTGDNRGDEGNKPVDRHKEAKKTTENNILVILSKLSYMDDQCTHLMSTVVFDTLILYAIQAKDPITRVERILRRLSQNPKCLEGILLYTIPLKFDLCHSVCKRYLKCKRRSTLACGGGDDNIAVSGEFNLNASCIELFTNLLNAVSMTVASKYGQGVVEHMLLTGNEEERLRCSLNLPVICRHEQTLKKYLFDTAGLEYVLKALQKQQPLEGEEDSRGVDPGIPVSLELIVHYLHKVALLGDLVLLYKGIGMNPKLHCCQRLLQQHNDASYHCHGNQGPKNRADVECCDSNHSIGDKKDDDAKSLVESQVEEVGTEKDAVTFLLDDGTAVKARRETLVKVSSVFAAMLEGPFSERHKSEIALPHIQNEPFKVLVSVLHGNVHGIEACCNPSGLEVLLEILKLCDRFLLADYLQDLSNVVFSLINSANLVDVLYFSVQHNCSVLARRCLSYLLICDVPLSQRLVWIKKLLELAGVNEVVDLLRNVFTNHMSAKFQVYKA